MSNVSSSLLIHEGASGLHLFAQLAFHLADLLLEKLIDDISRDWVEDVNTKMQPFGAHMDESLLTGIRVGRGS